MVGDIRRGGGYVSRREMQDARNEAVAETQQSAHDRFVRRRTNFIESNPGAVSGMERDSFLGRQRKLEDDYELRKHEMDMLKQQGENALGIEKAKAEGMIGQGSKAAEFNADAAKYTADAQKEAALKKAEVDAANGAAQWGRFDNGQYIAGSNVAQAKAQTDANIKAAEIKAGADKYAADATVDVQTEKNKGIQATVDAERQLESFKHENAKELAEIKATKGVSVNREILNMLMLEQQHIKKTTGKDVSIVDLYNQKFGKDAE